MGVLAQFNYRPDGFVLAETVNDVPDVELEVIQMMGTSPDQFHLWVWIHGVEHDQIDSALNADSTVSEFVRYTETEIQTLYRIRVRNTEQNTYRLWVDAGAELCTKEYRDGWWRCTIRLPDREELSAVRDWFDTNGVEYRLESVFSDTGRNGTGIELSEQQRAVLKVALDKGYFEIPRKGTLDDVADELGISSQAASERLRRGHRQLVSYHL
ncbi:helix-turn-helix domain-containing protein [Halovenus marina]|uniref:helix-turn-helix domain-containing protein n=1 Tax=Halovenus marina TaxID=3396621 RepID=UPI003F56351A